MLSAKLIRLAGLTALVSAVLSMIGDLLSLVVDLENPVVATSTSYALVFSLYSLGTTLLLLGLVGLYTSQLEAAGILGVVGFLTAFAGTALVMGAIWFELFISPSLAARAPELPRTELGLAGFILSFISAGIGWILFGLATLRAGVYPRPAAVLLIVGALVSFTPIPLSGIVLSVAVAWLGFVLYTGGHSARAQPSLGS